MRPVCYVNSRVLQRMGTNKGLASKFPGLIPVRVTKGCRRCSRKRTRLGDTPSAIKAKIAGLAPADLAAFKKLANCDKLEFTYYKKGKPIKFAG